MRSLILSPFRLTPELGPKILEARLKSRIHKMFAWEGSVTYADGYPFVSPCSNLQ